MSGSVALRVSLSILRHVVVCAFLVIAATASVQAQTNALQSAQQLINEQKYDAAISLLNSEFQRNRKNARVALMLARSHHWKKDFPEAKRWYAEAAKLDPKNAQEVIPLLDELNEWKEIIRIGTPEFKAGTRLMSLLGSLWSAHHELGERAETERVLARILASPASDYRSYVLAYIAVLDGNLEKGLSYLAQIQDRGMRIYAKTSPKFSKLKDNVRFDELTR